MVSRAPVKRKDVGSNPTTRAIGVSVNGKPAVSKTATQRSNRCTSAKPLSFNGRTGVL